MHSNFMIKIEYIILTLLLKYSNTNTSSFSRNKLDIKWRKYNMKTPLY